MYNMNLKSENIVVSNANGIKMSCVVFSKDNRSFLFQPANGTSLMIDSIPMDVIKNMPYRLKAIACRRGIVVNDIPEKSQCYTPGFFLIDLTKACNNRCLYCFRNLNQKESISQARLEDVVNYIIGYCQTNNMWQITIQPWGGEPLLNWNGIKYIQDTLEAYGIKVRILIETNGVAVTTRIAKEAYERKIQMSISLDGPKEIHDSHRLLLDGGGSYEFTIRGLKRLQDAGFGNNIGIVCVVTRKSAQNIEDIISFFAKELQMMRVKTNIVKYSPLMKDKGLSLFPQSIADFEKRLVDSVLSVNRNGYNFGESNLVNVLHNLLSRKTINFCNSRGCQAGYRMVSFGMDGGIYPCDLTDHSDLKFGDIYESATLSQVIQRNSGHAFFQKERCDVCKDCYWYFYCKGGCSSSRIYTDRQIDSADCVRYKTLYPLAIELILTYPHLINNITNGEIFIGSS